MKRIIRVKYTNKTGVVGYSYIDLRTEFEKDIQDTGRKLGATLAWMDKNTVRGIRYDDKHSVGLTGNNEVERK
jgi:hypothetical protein